MNSPAEQALKLVTEQFNENPGISLEQAKIYAQYDADDYIMKLPGGATYRNNFMYWQEVKRQIDLIVL